MLHTQFNDLRIILNEIPNEPLLPMHSPVSSTHYQLLVVEDDIELASLIKDYLAKHGFTVNIINNGIEAAQAIISQKPNIVLLDVMLPGMSGMDICRQVRPHYSGPIIMLTALDEDMDQMLGLELGADDYIIKPVQPRLLLSRIRALLRRTGTGMITTEKDHVNKPDPAILKVAGLIICLTDRSVKQDDQLLDLTTAEFELLLMLAKEAGKVVERDLIIKRLRGLDYDGLDRSIDRRISRLRKKLQEPSEQTIIKTVRGKGYLLCLS